MRSFSVPRRQPIPSVSERGISLRVVSNGSFLYTPIYIPSSPSSPRQSPFGSIRGSSYPEQTGISFLSIAAETFFAVFISDMTKPFSAAHASQENLPAPSVAVVITGCAPISSASFKASAFAPPMWPDNTGMTNFPLSSITMTAGSVVLLFICGAVSRTAMPQAPMNISASLCSNSFFISAATLLCAVKP